MTFYESFTKLCEINKVSPTKLLVETLNMSGGNLTRWRDGVVPKANTLQKLASYFSVSTDYLLGNVNNVDEAKNEEDEVYLQKIQCAKLFKQLNEANKQMILAQMELMIELQNQ